jgi:small redox-active disulfide protein 2
MEIKVLGPGCGNCRATMALIQQVADARGISVELRKVENLLEIVESGVMSTPGVLIDGKLVHSGGVPKREKVEQWLAEVPA